MLNRIALMKKIFIFISPQALRQKTDQGKFRNNNSAGITIISALVSLFLNKCVDPFTAMTGEITLRGLVLPVGGIKEKVLAAHRAGIKKVLLPKRNERDLSEIPISVQSEMQIICCKTILEVLEAVGLYDLSAHAKL
jgi:ATP-dependent Lon protease